MPTLWIRHCVRQAHGEMLLLDISTLTVNQTCKQPKSSCKSEREIQIVDLHGLNYVHDLWKVLRQDVSAGWPRRYIVASHLYKWWPLRVALEQLDACVE